jgi:hypothetical protein
MADTRIHMQAYEVAPSLKTGEIQSFISRLRDQGLLRTEMNRAAQLRKWRVWEAAVADGRADGEILLQVRTRVEQALQLDKCTLWLSTFRFWVHVCFVCL